MDGRAAVGDVDHSVAMVRMRPWAALVRPDLAAIKLRSNLPAGAQLCPGTQATHLPAAVDANGA
jgi:hypothetical protein